MFADFGGGEPVDVHHGRWGGSSQGNDDLRCLGIDRVTRFGVEERLEYGELAAQAERLAEFLEGDGWEVLRFFDPEGKVEFRVSAARGTETIYSRYNLSGAAVSVATNNCGLLKTVTTYPDRVYVESFVD